MLKKIVAGLLCSAIFSLSFAQEAETKEPEKSPLEITGFADIFYRYDFAKTSANNLTSFTNAHNSFTLGMASVKFAKSFGKVGMVADLGFGQRAKEFSYNDEGITAGVKQLYVTYAPTDKLTFSFGSWATHVGYELVDAPANRNYSMSYMFSYGPFFHTGAKAEYSFGNSAIMLGVANPTDTKLSADAPRMILGQFSTGTADGKLKAYLNYLGGKGTDTTKMNQIDAVITAAVSDKFSIGYNGTVASFKEKTNGKFGSANSWWGSAIYLNADVSETFGLTLRTELFNDKKQLNVFGGAAKGGNIFANTLSAKIGLGDLTIIPEIRVESASQPIFINGKSGGSKSAGSALIAAIYSF